MSYSKLDRLKKELETAISENDLELALQVIDDMLDVDEENPQTWNSRGVIQTKLGDTDGAIESFDESIRLDPDSHKSWYGKGVVLMDSGKCRLALACFYKSLDIDPGFEKARTRFHSCLDRMVMDRSVGTIKQEAFSDSYIESPADAFERRSLEKVSEPPVHEEKRPDPEPFDPPKDDPFISRKGRKGSFLDEDLFEEEESFEDWGDEDENDDLEWDLEDEPEPVPLEFRKCRCDGLIPIYSNERPYKFKCPSCKRTGTIRN